MDDLFKQPLISVIIPVYNVEKYLKSCLDSVVSQTYKNLEIILVDDGSVDNSGKICDEYAEKDKRITVIHKENGGLSDARNVGIEKAQGSYITFVDSDDFIEKNFIKILVNIAINKKVHFVIGNYKKFVKDSRNKDRNAKYEVNENSITVFSPRETMLRMLYQKQLSMYAHGKLYDRKLFTAVRFPKGKLFEDVPTIWSIVKQVDKVAYVNYKLYFYRQRNGSIVNNTYSHRKMDQVYFSKEILEEVKNDDELYKAAISKYFFCLADIYAQVDKENKEDRKFLEKELKKYEQIVSLDDNNSKSLRIMAKLGQTQVIIIRILGKGYKMYKKMIWSIT